MFTKNNDNDGGDGGDDKDNDYNDYGDKMDTLFVYIYHQLLDTSNINNNGNGYNLVVMIIASMHLYQFFSFTKSVLYIHLIE